MPKTSPSASSDKTERLVVEAIELFLTGETRKVALAWLRVRADSYRQLERLG